MTGFRGMGRERGEREHNVHVVQSPGVGLAGAGGMRDIVGVFVVPGILAQLALIVSERIACPGAGPAGVFPFGFGKQAVTIGGGIPGHVVTVTAIGGRQAFSFRHTGTDAERDGEPGRQLIQLAQGRKQFARVHVG